MSNLPEPWFSTYADRKEAINARLADFARVPVEDYFYELAFCILTPQSSAKNAEAVIAKLIHGKFLETGFDPTTTLRDNEHYIRFHNTKAKRLLAIRADFQSLQSSVTDHFLNPEAKREIVIAKVSGLGMKEASHFLRNIGVRGLAILDRHIYRHLHRLGIIENIPTSGPTKKQYLEIEAKWKMYAQKIGISMDELDLLFWSMETGVIRK